MKILVDFDNTVQLWGEPKTGAIDVLRKWMHEGHVITIWTSRPEADFPAIYSWFESYGIKPNAIVRKPYCDLYIDDRSVNPSIGWERLDAIVTGE